MLEVDDNTQLKLENLLKKQITDRNANVLRKYMSLIMRKPYFKVCENKDADQLRGNREADQRLCFCYRDSTVPLLPKSEISSI